MTSKELSVRAAEEPRPVADGFPPDWSMGTIEETCEKPEYGFTDSARIEPVGPKFLRITDIQGGRVDWTSVPHCRCKDKVLSRLRLRPGDLLIARIGGTTGKSFLVRNSPEAVFASYLIRLRPRAIDAEFLYYFCQSHFYWRQVLASKGEKLKGGVSASTLSQISLPLPSPPEQRAIAGVLSKLQARVELQDRIVASLRDLKAATMAKLFREGLRGEPLKQTEIGEMPESWNVVLLGDHCQISSGGTPSRDHPEYWGGQIPWIRTAEINYRPIRNSQESITEIGLQNSAARVLPPGTLLLAMYGEGVTRGRVAVLEIEAATNQACAALLTGPRLASSFLYAYLCHAYDRIRQLGHGANQKNLSADLIRTIRVPLPRQLEEQHAIASIVSGLERLEAVAENSGATLTSLFHELLQLLTTGKLRIRHAS